MISGAIEGQTRELGKPEDWIDEKHGKCLSLKIRDQYDGRLHEMISAWFPTESELERLKAGAPIYLCLVGQTHPPVALLVGEAPPE